MSVVLNNKIAQIRPIRIKQTLQKQMAQSTAGQSGLLT
jgi:hypothetical protein